MSETAELRLPDGKTIELPIVVGSEGERAVDITKLRAKTGYITLDPGYANSGSCQSAITFIDGEQGILRYRGIPIEELAEKSSFIEVAYLLIYGKLPTQTELENYAETISRHTMLHEDLKLMFNALPKDAHPMAACSTAIGALSTFYPDSLDPRDPEEVDISMHRLIAKLPTLAAYAYKHSIGQPFLYPKNDLDYVGNFLRMMFGTPCEEYEVDPVVKNALDLLFILHADHEQNCSTSTTRLVGSSMVNLFSTISAAINALWGPLHGGANQAVIEMLEAIADEGTSAREYLGRAKSGDESARLMGFGHRVYKNYDPRAKVIKKACDDVLDRMGIHSPLLEIAKELEEITLKDDYFVERKLYPNVDFYSGVIYSAIGTPPNMFTAMFAIGRLPGWIAQWKELHDDPAFKIGRPRQIYTGPNVTSYVPMSER
ncbi:MAG TPA: citrate synthase [Myxococcota bacterium]|nr:citrate synthase [Myxococcales bacterium]HPG24337.1 citrate synthase [Myxococcota bacterium]